MTAPLLFAKTFGKPDPAAPMGIRFKISFAQEVWEETARRIGAGYFMNRFLFLFGEGLERLQACLNAWSFLVPPSRDRLILGYNAYGSILVLEDANKPRRSVRVLDPFRVAYWGEGSFNLLNLVSHWLPERQIPHFLDDGLYQSWVKGDEYLPEGYILGAQRPEGLGGGLTEDNVQPEEIVSYYQTTGPLYAKAFVRTGRQPPAKPGKQPKRKR